MTNRLNVFEAMHEDNLVKESIEYENDKDVFAHHQRYSQYAPKKIRRISTHATIVPERNIIEFV